MGQVYCLLNYWLLKIGNGVNAAKKVGGIFFFPYFFSWTKKVTCLSAGRQKSQGQKNGFPNRVRDRPPFFRANTLESL